MKRGCAFVVVALVACHDEGAPVAPMIAASSAPAVAATPDASAPPPSGEKTPESCATLASGKPELAGCTWSVDKHSCVCNGCLADSDCSARTGGSCATLTAAKSTMPSAKVCLYPGEDCFAGARCAKGRACNHDGMGRSSGCSGQGDFKPK